ncbi:hypothetical protein LWI29_028538 [Acer saccharum]|uniref:Protein XRI1 n=1 Tax=Acer saccharum TaxID=4024 RepID=A0AA39RLS6_ACESA|nr:hypothetical protein LWI29_028538 [Acer saccharum]KAK1552097.1 hypothetical protein Q3G72_010289 [Acer saccharum]
MAYTSSNSSNFYSSSSTLSWDLQNLGVFNADMSLVMDGGSPFFSPDDHDFSTGYLEDALVEFSDRSKRRRLLLSSDDDEEDQNGSKDLISSMSYWNNNSSCNWGHEVSENFSCMSQLTSINDEAATGSFFLDHEHMSRGSAAEEANMVKTPEETTFEALDSSSSTYRDSIKTSKSIFDDDEKMRKKGVITTRVVYPFALVKPGGVDGDVTLNDINERILMPPTRPVRHPVGDFACRPTCVSADGPGLSGKAVVALTRIHTQGRGTITIIRTKG